MLNLILTESAIENVPPQLARHPSVIAQARRKGKEPGALILDRSFHHSAIRRAEARDPSQSFLKRGRPDIVFHVLVQVLGSPLNLEGLLRTHVHTVDDKVIDLDPKIKIPRNYDRFIGLLEQLFAERNVPPGEQPLMRIRECTLSKLVGEIGASVVAAFSTIGRPASVEDVCSRISSENVPTVLIGGFAHSNFCQSTIRLANHVFSIDKDPLEAWVVAARVIYEYERKIKLPERRLKG